MAQGGEVIPSNLQQVDVFLIFYLKKKTADKKAFRSRKSSTNPFKCLLKQIWEFGNGHAYEKELTVFMRSR